MTEDQYTRAKEIKEQMATLETWEYRLKKSYQAVNRDILDKEEILAVYQEFSMAIRSLKGYKEREFKEL